MNQSTTDPTLIFIGIVIVLLLAANLALLLLRERSKLPDHIPAPPDPPVEHIESHISKPSLRRIVLSGFDSNNKAVRFEFTFEELQGQGIVIGRSRDARAQLGDDLVGRAHARLYGQNERLLLEDLKSLNGTFVNGEQLPKGGERAVEIGSEIGVGPKVKLRLSKLG